jgi:hypothetical protein
MLVRQLGVSRPVAIFDSEDNKANAQSFRSAAEKLRLDVEGVLTWGPREPEPLLAQLKRPVWTACTSPAATPT